MKHTALLGGSRMSHVMKLSSFVENVAASTPVWDTWNEDCAASKATDTCCRVKSLTPPYERLAVQQEDEQCHLKRER